MVRMYSSRLAFYRDLSCR